MRVGGGVPVVERPGGGVGGRVFNLLPLPKPKPNDAPLLRLSCNVCVMCAPR